MSATTLDIREEQLGPSFLKHHIHLGDDVFVVLHKFTIPDRGDPHTHPWDFKTMITKGSYVEEIFDIHGNSERFLRRRGDFMEVPAYRIHRIVDLPEGECCTAVLYGPKVQDFGFYQFREDGTYFRLSHESEFVRVKGRA